MNEPDQTAAVPGHVASTDELSGSDPKRAWDVMRVPCSGPCWNGHWLVFQARGQDVGPYHLNAAGNVKRFRSEASARGVAAKLNAEGTA